MLQKVNNRVSQMKHATSALSDRARRYNRHARNVRARAATLAAHSRGPFLTNPLAQLA